MDLPFALQEAAPETPLPVRGSLSDLAEGEQGVLDQINLKGDDAQRIMELGFIPGAHITVGRSAPGGDPRVYRVDGAEVALRRETAVHLKLRRPPDNRR